MTVLPDRSTGAGTIEGVRAPDRFSGSSPMAFLPHLVAVPAGMVMLAMPPELGLRALSIVAIVYALHLTWARGGRYLTPSGVFFLASGVFIGLASHYLLQVGSRVSIAELRDHAVVAFLATVAVAAVVTAISVHWRLRWPGFRWDGTSVDRLETSNLPINLQLKSVALIVVSQLPPVEAQLGQVAGALGLTGVIMMITAASSRRVKLRWHGDLVIVAMAAIVPLIWMQLEFQGGGRLRLAGLGIATVLIWNLVRPRVFHKVLVVVSIPAFLLFSSFDRLADDDERRTTDAVSTGAGLGSVYTPLSTWAELRELDPEESTRLEPGPWYGRTFLSTAAMPIPRAMWDDKPIGFGAELTQLLRARSLDQGRIPGSHSMAGLMHGEWYVNFGLVGLPMMAVVIGWFLAVLDRAHLRLVHTGLSSPAQWWRAIILACLVSSLGDLFWVGSFTFYARGGLAAVTAFALWRLGSRRPARTSPGTSVA